MNDQTPASHSKLFPAILVVALAALLTVSATKYDLLDGLKRTAHEEETFVLEALAQANRLRSLQGQPPLRLHPEMQLLTVDLAQTMPVTTHNFSDVFDLVEQEVPRIHELGANLLVTASRERLLEELNKWQDLTHSDHTHYALALFQPERGRGRIGCLAVLARELPQLSFPMRPVADQPYYDICQRCDRGHGVTLGQMSRSTLVIHCPHCRRPYNLLAAESSGSLRRANQFLNEHTKPASAKGQSVARVLEIWREVAAKCRYQLDTQKLSGGDSWKLPHETLENGAGDCEDTSILLADLLAKEGYDVRVALGRHKGEGHAWCVLRFKGVQYLMESTLEDLDSVTQLPRVSDKALHYYPEYQFDRDRLYFNKTGSWTSDYWSVGTWDAIGNSQPGFAAPVLAATSAF